MIVEIASISGGAILGALGRHFLTILVEDKIKTIEHINLSNTHMGTATVNILGSFIIGIVSSLAIDLNYSKNLKLFLLTGVLASFTTFSSFTLYETEFLKNKEISYWLLYIFLNLVGSLIFVYLGLFIGSKIASQIKKKANFSSKRLKS